MLQMGIREGLWRVERLGGCAGSFFVGVCDDIYPADRFGGTLATSTGRQWFRIVQHVAESYREERVRWKGRLVVKVASESVESP